LIRSGERSAVHVKFAKFAAKLVGFLLQLTDQRTSDGALRQSARILCDLSRRARELRHVASIRIPLVGRFGHLQKFLRAP
jgi:hypothetical protein